MEKNNQNTDFIYGKNPVIEALSTNPKRINKIFFQDKISFDNRLKKIMELAKSYGILTKFCNLNNFSEEKLAHQGVIATISPVEYIDFDDFIRNLPKEGFKKVIILDEVSDPHNFGAIIRTGACAGFDAIIVSNHRSAPITNTVEKVSMGAVNHIKIVKVNSISAIIDYLKKEDWWIIATEVLAKDNYFDIDYTDMNFALIMGSEGKGVSKTLLNKADFRVRIPVNFESLNVSNATAVIVYEAVRQIQIKNSQNVQNS